MTLKDQIDKQFTVMMNAQADYQAQRDALEVLYRKRIHCKHTFKKDGETCDECGLVKHLAVGVKTD